MYNTDLKTAIFLADGFEEVEALSTYDMLFRAGIPVSLVSINPDTTVTSSHRVTIAADTTIDQLSFDDLDMIILPGGIPGTPNLEACETLTTQIKAFAAAGKPIAAICAAPSIFAHLGLLAGKRATCNPSKDKDLDEGGAIRLSDPVVVDGNIITSRAAGTAIPFGLTIVAHYLGREAAEDIRKNILFA